MELADLLPLLAAAIVCAVCWMTLIAYRNTLGALLTVLANAVPNITILGHNLFGWLSGGLNAINSQINQWLSDAVSGTQLAFEKVLNITATLLHDTFRNLAELAEGVERDFRHTWNHFVPASIRAQLGPVHSAIAFLQGELAKLLKEGVKASNTITHVVTHDIPKVTTNVIRVTKVEVEKVTKTVVRSATVTLPRVGALERDVAGLEKWIKRHTKDLTIAGLASLLIGGVLAKIGMTWLRCSNVQRFGRHVCGIAPKVLEDLLLGLTAIFGTLSLVELAKQMQALVGGLEGEIVHFWRADVAPTSSDRRLGQTGL
jgi:hypothetical protein